MTYTHPLKNPRYSNFSHWFSLTCTRITKRYTYINAKYYRNSEHVLRIYYAILVLGSRTVHDDKYIHSKALAFWIFPDGSVQFVRESRNVIGFFCRILSLLKGSFGKETYNLIDPTNRS